MTPLQLARAKCANWEVNGGCLGMEITPDGRTIPLWLKAPPRCVLSDGQPCTYFETAVLAGINAINDERKVNEWQEAADIYAKGNGQNEDGPGKGNMERARNDGAPRLHEVGTAAAHSGMRASGSQIRARCLRLSGRGREQLARGTEDQ